MGYTEKNCLRSNLMITWHLYTSPNLASVSLVFPPGSWDLWLDIPRMCQIGLNWYIHSFTHSHIHVSIRYMFLSSTHQCYPSLILSFLDLQHPPPLSLQTLALDSIFPTSNPPMPNVDEPSQALEAHCHHLLGGLIPTVHQIPLEYRYGVLPCLQNHKFTHPLRQITSWPTFASTSAVL